MLLFPEMDMFIPWIFWDITNNTIYENVDVVDVVGYSGIYIYT